MINDSIGIDISKDWLDAFRLSNKAHRAFDNTSAGYDGLRRWLGDLPVSRIVYEATGPYHGAFECALASDFPLVKVNPLQARMNSRNCRSSASSRPSRPRSKRACARMTARPGSSTSSPPFPASVR